MKERVVSIKRKCDRSAEALPIEAKDRLRRPLQAAILHGRLSGVNAADIPRRQFLHLATGAAALSTASGIARAQTYPTRPVRLLVGFVPGGGADILARLMGQWLSDRLGQPFIIENRAGAGGNVATEAAVRAAGDGYTLLLATVPNAVNATLYDKLNFNFIQDIAPVAGIMGVPLVMEVHPLVPAKSVPDFIAYAKSNPDKLNMGSGGFGTGQHVTGELFKMMTGVDMLHVPYRGSAAALTDLLGGQIQVMFDNIPSSIEYIRAGKLRALGVTTKVRSEALPGVPMVGDFVSGFEASGWFGVVAPKATPTEIVRKLNAEINAILADPEMKGKLIDLGGTVIPGSPTAFGRFISEDTEKWAKVIKFAGIKPM
jgi:tripartite-type tricarboxylate transporter receptor subunit TctC